MMQTIAPLSPATKVPLKAGATDPIRVFIADDHVLVREGLRLIIEAQNDMEVVGEASGRPGGVEAHRPFAARCGDARCFDAPS